MKLAEAKISATSGLFPKASSKTGRTTLSCAAQHFIHASTLEILIGHKHPSPSVAFRETLPSVTFGLWMPRKGLGAQLAVKNVK